MKCIYCGCMDSKVIDSRQNEEGTSIRRRRECENCGKRFTTYETVESTPILVIKKDGSRQTFDPAKVKRGIMKACEKRPISMTAIDKMVADIQRKILNSLEQEVSSKYIGELSNSKTTSPTKNKRRRKRVKIADETELCSVFSLYFCISARCFHAISHKECSRP